MPKEALSVRHWYAFSVRDFYSDPVVIAMTREQRWRYRDSIDFSWLSETPGVGPESDWQGRMGYSDDEWKSVRHIFMRAFTISDGVWTQKRLVREYQLAVASIDQRREAGKRGGEARWRPPSDRLAPAEHSPSGYMAQRHIQEQEPKNPATSPLRSEVAPPASDPAPNPTPTPPTNATSRTVANNVEAIRLLAAKLAMPKAQKHQPAWTAPVWEWIKVHVPADKQSAMMAFAGWLHKTGTADPDEMLSLVKHAHVYDPRNPMAYFANTGTTRANIAMTVQLDKRIIEHEELKRADRELFGVANRRA
jgi:uncharacterized protein YdaU (DUF1376 family)